MKKIGLLFICLLVSVAFSVNTDWGYVKLINRTSYSITEGGANSFDLLKARFLMGGDIVKDLVFLGFQADLNTTGINILDAKGIFKLNPLKITVGRFLAPIDYYTTQSLAHLNTIDYPILEKFSPWRQVGIMLSYGNKLLNSYVMVSNGGGKNTYEETDTEKAYMVRMDIMPFKGISIGGSSWQEKYLTGSHYTVFNRSNFLLNVRENNFFFNTQFSYIEDEDPITDKNIYSYAYFLHLSVYMKKFEILTRYEYTDEDINSPGTIRTRLTVGLNYNIKGPAAQIAVNYQRNGESDEIQQNNDKFIVQFMFIL
jgi:hypothetical protein